jgi:3',5'-cyclic AMP phosphodiesterase CpdA
MLARLLCFVASLLTLAALRPDLPARFLPASLPAPGVFSAQQTAPPALDIRIPLQKGSVRFAVVGDTGTGDQPEFQVGKEMEAYRQRAGFDFVIMLGDNIYGGHKPQDFAQKFEQPFKPLLDAGVKFYASLGNHDDPNDERLYKPFNMGGERYYVFKRGDVAFFVLDSNYFDPTQLSWLTQNLQQSNARWKIAYFHHPLFNDGQHHGPDLDLRAQLVPLFHKYGVNAVFSGHEHVYQRMKPEDGIYYFVLGNSAKLMDHDFGELHDAQKTFDTDRAFMLVEITPDKLYFQTIARNGVTIDSGELTRQAQP